MLPEIGRLVADRLEAIVAAVLQTFAETQFVILHLIIMVKRARVTVQDPPGDSLVPMIAPLGMMLELDMAKQLVPAEILNFILAQQTVDTEEVEPRLQQAPLGDTQIDPRPMMQLLLDMAGLLLTRTLGEVGLALQETTSKAILIVKMPTTRAAGPALRSEAKILIRLFQILAAKLPKGLANMILLNGRPQEDEEVAEQIHNTQVCHLVVGIVDHPRDLGIQSMILLPVLYLISEVELHSRYKVQTPGLQLKEEQRLAGWGRTHVSEDQVLIQDQTQGAAVPPDRVPVHIKQMWQGQRMEGPWLILVLTQISKLPIKEDHPAEELADSIADQQTQNQTQMLAVLQNTLGFHFLKAIPGQLVHMVAPFPEEMRLEEVMAERYQGATLGSKVNMEVHHQRLVMEAIFPEVTPSNKVVGHMEVLSQEGVDHQALLVK